MSMHTRVTVELSYIARYCTVRSHRVGCCTNSGSCLLLEIFFLISRRVQHIFFFFQLHNLGRRLLAVFLPEKPSLADDPSIYGSRSSSKKEKKGKRSKVVHGEGVNRGKFRRHSFLMCSVGLEFQRAYRHMRLYRCWFLFARPHRRPWKQQ